MIGERSAETEAANRASSCDKAKVVIGIDAAALIYYAVAAEPITTVAHFCAIVLGVVLCLCCGGYPFGLIFN